MDHPMPPPPLEILEQIEAVVSDILAKAYATPTELDREIIKQAVIRGVLIGIKADRLL